MESIEFLKSQLKDLHAELPQLNVRYEYREYLNTHIIEVRPVEIFEGYDNYILKQIFIEETFEEKYPFEEILFMTENILIDIQNPLLELDSIDDITVNQIDYVRSVINDVEEPFKEFYELMINDSVKSSNSKIDYFKCTGEVNQLIPDDYNSEYIWVAEKPKSHLERFKQKIFTQKNALNSNQSIFF